MVSGGTYGTEEIVNGAGYGHGILILLFLPVLWCLPTAFMIGELSSALPEEGGYYAWVRRGLGNFWGFQEAWLSLAASIFDMAIYPTLFVFYLKQMSPWFGVGNHGVLAGLFVVVTCAALNVAGIRVVGITSLWLFFMLSAPFALIVVLAPMRASALGGVHASETGAGLGLLGGVLVAMWNYMGWDNASTIAQEVEKPQRTYPKAMIAAVVLVSLTYVLPFLAVYAMGVPASTFAEDGSWATVAGLVGGKIMGFEWLRFLVVLGGMMSAFGMFNALVMSYSRLPLAMARDGMLPKICRDQGGHQGTLGGDYCLCDMLGSLPGPRIQEAGDARHHALRRGVDAGICDTGGVAHSRAEFEARIPRAWGIDRCDSRRPIPVDPAEYRDGGK